MAADGDAEWRRRSELSGLLRACRSRLTRPVPGGIGAGMRQEDVADLVKISVRRYAEFERGQIASPGPELVDKVGSALRMAPAERACLHVLATGREPAPAAAPTGRDGRAAVSRVFSDLIARQDPSPALITDETWTVLAGNDAMSAWAGGWPGQEPDGHPNLALHLFSGYSEERLPDVRAARRAVVAGLRYQYARNLASDRFAALVARLRATGPEARELWDRHEVAIPPAEYRFRVRHPDRGLIEASAATMRISAWHWMHIVVFPDGVLPPGR